jgi:hypothetical protein
MFAPLGKLAEQGYRWGSHILKQMRQDKSYQYKDPKTHMEEDTEYFIDKEQPHCVTLLSSTYTDNTFLSYILYNMPIKY